jgi:hypothetical protein
LSLLERLNSAKLNQAKSSLIANPGLMLCATESLLGARAPIREEAVSLGIAQKRLAPEGPQPKPVVCSPHQRFRSAGWQSIHFTLQRQR